MMAKIVPVWFKNKEWKEMKDFLDRFDIPASKFLRKLGLSQVYRIREEEETNKEKRKTIYD
jgi:hypothetical protein